MSASADLYIRRNRRLEASQILEQLNDPCLIQKRWTMGNLPMHHFPGLQSRYEPSICIFMTHIYTYTCKYIRKYICKYVCICVSIYFTVLISIAFAFWMQHWQLCANLFDPILYWTIQLMTAPPGNAWHIYLTRNHHKRCSAWRMIFNFLQIPDCEEDLAWF